MNFNLDNQDFINNEFQNLIFKIKSLANDINQNNDKNANLSQLQNILNNIQYLNKKVIEEINTILSLIKTIILQIRIFAIKLI